jgi:hypothetical protein
MLNADQRGAARACDRADPVQESMVDASVAQNAVARHGRHEDAR